MANRPTYTISLNLVKPDIDDSYDITLFNGNMDKIDTEIGNLKNTIKNIDLVDSKVKITDLQNKFTGTTLDVVLNEIDDKIGNVAGSINLNASNITYQDSWGTHYLGASNVQRAIEALFTKIRTLETENTNLKSRVESLETELNGQVTRLNGINTELATEIGTPTV